MTDESLENLGAEIVKSFHEQFAQNQNHHQKLFLQVMAILITVLVGFGYLYIRVGVGSTELNVTVETLYAFLALASYFLSLGVALILNMALGFRRDQMVACNIRVKTRVMRIDDPNTVEFFPSTFNPVRADRGWFDWMPEFHKIFFLTLCVAKLLLFLSVILNRDFQPNFSVNDADLLITSALVLIGLSVPLDCMIVRYYNAKWNVNVDGAPSRLKPDAPKGLIDGAKSAPTVAK